MEILEQEIWKYVPWYELLYQVSNLGNIRSMNYNRKWIIKSMKPYKWTTWYLYIDIFKNKEIKRISLSRIIAFTFLWLNIDNKEVCVCHKDDNPLNNKIDNLFLWTHQDNMKDRDNKWRCRAWIYQQRIISQFTKNWEFIRNWESQKLIQNELWILSTSINKCCRLKRWHKTAGWFMWKYFI